jgi:transcriptional regulator with XRE-family HTH domain
VRSDVLAYFLRELRDAVAVSGLTGREVARRARMSQPQLSRLLRGLVAPDLDEAERIVAATGHRLVVKVVPGDGIRLRDSGQWVIAQVIQSEAHARWRIRLEVAVAPPPDRRAVDLVLEQPAEVAAVEIERGMSDAQAQFRSGELKRAALAERLGREVRLVIAVPDTSVLRQRLAPFASLIGATFPVTSRAAWAAIRSGEPLGADALLWVRPRALRAAGRR